MDHWSRRFTLPALALAMFAVASSASDKVAGERREYHSPGGITETCIALEKMPGGNYSDADTAREKALCELDFYAADVALCPKLRSTSPGTFVYRIDTDRYTGQQAGFERDICPRGELLPAEAEGSPASFKVTMNDRETSATFSTASLLYYHFSRYFDTSIRVPVAVYRSMDREAHAARVSARGLQGTAGQRSLKMIHAAWQVLADAEQQPAHYPATSELFTSDLSQIYGVMLRIHGKRFGAEINGTRKSGWGVGQNNDFQRTAPFLALRSELPLPQAIAAGIEEAGKDPDLRKAMPDTPSTAQMHYWMQGLTEITLLDFIFSQQDRIGNIDYEDIWRWADSDGVHSSDSRPSGDAATMARAFRRIRLNDNDAGGRARYVNYTRKTGMLEKIRHYNAGTYRRLMQLNSDFSKRGTLFNYLRDSYGLTDRQLESIVTNTRDAAGILRASCEAGKLRFDLDPAASLAGQAPGDGGIDCAGDT
ncbi:hypothetical protein [Haliea sp. E17]|uniref:hypothetical protein n=1 Tax=Haliea sp. E17 TaxID=3401576 RepID=UPI003AACA960